MSVARRAPRILAQARKSRPLMMGADVQAQDCGQEALGALLGSELGRVYPDDGESPIVLALELS